MAAEALVTQFNDRSVGACLPRHTVAQNYNDNFFYQCEENQLRGKGRRHASEAFHKSVMTLAKEIS